VLATLGVVGLLLWLWRSHVSFAPSHMDMDSQAAGPAEF
jgi:hypothetical protein